MGVSAAAAFGGALVAAFALGRPLINFLRAISAKQTAYEDAPKPTKPRPARRRWAACSFCSGRWRH